MFGLDMKPEKMVSEFLEYQNKLAAGAQNLMNLEEIPTGVTPKEIVYTEDKLTLYHFKSDKKKSEINKTPILIAYALVNRPYMTDLQEGRSMVQGLLDAGQDVYLIDWGYPDAADRYLTLDDYINGYIDNCVRFVCEANNIDKINLLGICQGGAFSLCYTALNPDRVKNLITMVTPVDFQTKENMLSHWIQKVDVDLLVDTMGNVSGDHLNWTFLNLKPYALMSQKYVNMVDIMDNPKVLKNFMRMEKWIFDSPDQAGAAYAEFMKQFYQQNGLIKGTVEIGGKTVSLKDIQVPVLNIYAEQDHLVPPSASKALKKYIGTKDYTELSFPGGHIGIYVSGKAQAMVPPAIGEWLDAR